MAGERIPEQNTLGYLQKLVQTNHPEITLVAVELQPGNPNYSLSPNPKVSTWRYLSVHQPLVHPHGPEDFHASPIRGARVRPIEGCMVGKIALASAGLPTNISTGRYSDLFITVQMDALLEAVRAHRPLLGTLIDPGAEWQKISEYMRG